MEDQLGNRQSKIGNVLAEMERFERSQDFSRHLSGVLPCQLGDISKWRKATESNRTRLLAAAVFKTV